MVYTSQLFGISSKLIADRPDTVLVEKGQITMLKFPFKVVKCITDNQIEATIQDKSVFITANKEGRVFVMLENGLVPSYVVLIQNAAPASYIFTASISQDSDSLLYDEISKLVAAMYHETDLVTYHRKIKNKPVKLSIGRELKECLLKNEYIGKYFGYDLKANFKVDTIPENLFWVNGIVAVALVDSNIYIVADRELFTEERK